MSKLSEINLREKNFHNKLQSGLGIRFENRFYRALYNLSEDYCNMIKENCQDKIALDFGCGVGEFTRKIFNFKPKELFAIDISDVSIEKAKKNSIGMDIKYSVDNCEKSNFNDEKFDLVYGSGIIHHLDTKICVSEIYRILKRDGKMIFIEPLGTNPIINLYRFLTPRSRSSDEHPLIKKDFKTIKELFKNLSVRYYGLLTLLFLPFYKSPEKSKIFKILSKLDQCLFKIKILRIFAWSVLITCKKN